VASVLWRRLDVPGHDTCRLEQTAAGWMLEGTAVFAEDGSPASLAYRLECDSQYRTLAGEVRGWHADKPIAVTIARSVHGEWTLDGGIVRGLDGCLDLDFGFTPATNLSQLRRIALAEGQGVDVPVAWLDVATGRLDVLQQRYQRRTRRLYWYEAPRFEYKAMLDVGPAGFIERYPGLWEAERGAPPGEVR
jgi:hypothetical protein